MKYRVDVTTIDDEGNEVATLTTFFRVKDEKAHGPSMQCNINVINKEATFMERVECVRDCESAIKKYSNYLDEQD